MDIFTQEIREEKDILAARDRARVISEETGYGVTQQLQITTAVFELGKNILEHGGGGSITFAIQTDDDSLWLEVIGVDEGPGLSDERVEELLSAPSSSTALRGVAAMKRMMDKVEIETEPGSGTTIKMIKKKPESSKNLARNIVSFFNKKFSSRKSPTISEELRVQNQNLVQTLSLFEEKNEELQETNQKLLELKQELEKSNDELQQRTSELQDALLSLGDRTSELESQNRRFTAVLKQMTEGVAITDRSGVVTHANSRLFCWFGVKEDEVVGVGKADWLGLLGKHGDEADANAWLKLCNELDQNPKSEFEYHFRSTDPAIRLQCRTAPILDHDEKMIGRLWFFHPMT
ncbi:MAG: hypothetical protein GC154_13995 [bacterium]|nr:hypothetical protein [bacterium]